jgi:hypothetical protein
MRPNLFAGPALRDDNHRFLARLANGGSVPAPSRQSIWQDKRTRGRLTTVGALLCAVLASWTWLQRDVAPVGRPSTSPQLAASHTPRGTVAATDGAPSSAAHIVNETPKAATEVVPPVARASGSAVSSPSGGQASTATTASRTARPRLVRSDPVPRAERDVPAENDEDVTLLAAMLKHAAPQKAKPTAPKQ